MILSELSFALFFTNLVFLLFILFRLEVPKFLSRYMFFSFFMNIIGVITQMYSIGQGYGDWYMKSFPVVVGLTSFTFCLDLYNNSIRK
jgi:uncharacterized membrane protein